ncbi:hypothetical protein O6H91_15G044800 [Diphasiastrum complanatum]|nr:hypothetical protein O6H91_15G044800 [Diphasiastrum complanatum]
MHQILEGIKDRNLKPALEWTRLHHSELNEKGSCLEFKLQQLQFVHILLESGRLAALQHARSSFKYYATLHMGEIQRLMGCLLWAKRLDCCPYRDLLDPKHWEVILIEFTKEFCNLIGQAYNSPLYVTILAGCEALPSLIKLASVMANRISEWRSLKQLPVEIQLPNSLQFHSIFSCPVSRDQSTADNPPMLMPCGHVLCRQSIQKLAKGPSQSFKCPYCPLEVYISNCRQINF